MIQVTIKNLSDEVIASQQWDTEELAESWVASQVANNSWGLPETYSVEYEDIGNAPQMEQLRLQRNTRLLECDWTQLADAPLSVEEKADWATYRQALRDLPQQEGLDPNNPTWPEQP